MISVTKTSFKSTSVLCCQLNQFLDNLIDNPYHDKFWAILYELIVEKSKVQIDIVSEYYSFFSLRNKTVAQSNSKYLYKGNISIEDISLTEPQLYLWNVQFVFICSSPSEKR